MTAKRASNPARNVATMMFIDILGCSTISNILGVKQYGVFLGTFRRIATSCIEAILQDNYRTKARHKVRKRLPKYLQYSVRGDEACVILFSDFDKERPQAKERARTLDANTAIEIALQIKQEWLRCAYNKKQIKEGKLPCDLAIGINSGPIHITKQRTKRGTELLAEGYAINLAKRIEGESRTGDYSHILVGQRTKTLYESDFGESIVFFGKVRMADLKGITQPVPTYEVKYFTLSTGLDFLSRPDPYLWEREERERQRAKGLLPLTYSAWQADESSAWLATVYGNQCLAAGKDEEAEMVFVGLRRAHPKDPEPHCLLGNVYGEQGEYQDERRCYTRAIDLDPFVPEWHYYLGLCLSYVLEKEESQLSDEKLQERIGEILDCFKEAIYLNRRFSWAYYDKACVLNHYGQKDEAQDELDKAASMDEECKVAALSEPYLQGLHGGPPSQRMRRRRRPLRKPRKTG